MSTQILIQETSTLQTMPDHLEELWGCLDGLFAELEPRDWSRKHGPDWVLADLPYHLAYFDRDIIADPIEQGPNLPLEARLSLSSQVEINAWNAQKLAERPAGQTVTEGQAARPDLVITQSPECYVKTNVGMLDPATAIQTGEIQVSNFESLETFGQLFPG